VHNSFFDRGLIAPDPTGGAYNAPQNPDPLAGLRGLTSKGGGRGERGERESRRGDELNGMGGSFCKFLDPPLSVGKIRHSLLIFRPEN